MRQAYIQTLALCSRTVFDYLSCIQSLPENVWTVAIARDLRQVLLETCDSSIVQALSAVAVAASFLRTRWHICIPTCRAQEPPKNAQLSFQNGGAIPKRMARCIIQVQPTFRNGETIKLKHIVHDRLCSALQIVSLQFLQTLS
jgi:hypothetical protein